MCVCGGLWVGLWVCVFACVSVGGWGRGKEVKS